MIDSFCSAVSRHIHVITCIIEDADAILEHFWRSLESVVLKRIANHLTHAKGRLLTTAGTYQLIRRKINSIVNVVVRLGILDHGMHGIRTLRVQANRGWLFSFVQSGSKALAVCIPSLPHDLSFIRREQNLCSLKIRYFC